MPNLKIVKRLVACFGTIQLITALSVLDYREKEQQEYREKAHQELNIEYENHLVITPLWAPEGQVDEFVAFIQKMATSMRFWKNITYISHDQTISLTKKLNHLSLSTGASLVYDILEITNPDELYLAREWRPENQILLNVYASAEKICYGDGIGIYFSQSTFSSPNFFKDLYSFLRIRYVSLREKIKAIKDKETFRTRTEFDVGYFSLPSAFNEIPPMKIVTLDKTIYLKTFHELSKKLDNLLDISYINNLRSQIQDASVSILLTSNFSEAADRISLENEIGAYKEFLETQGIPENSVLLIKPHPRDSRNKISELKSALTALYSDIFVLEEGNIFYLPFEVFFMKVFLSESPRLQTPKIYAFSSACLTLEFLFNAECVIGFGSNIIKKFFYKEYVSIRMKHETDLRSAIEGIRLKKLSASQIYILESSPV